MRIVLKCVEKKPDDLGREGKGGEGMPCRRQECGTA